MVRVFSQNYTFSPQIEMYAGYSQQNIHLTKGGINQNILYGQLVTQRSQRLSIPRLRHCPVMRFSRRRSSARTRRWYHPRPQALHGCQWYQDLHSAQAGPGQMVECDHRTPWSEFYIDPCPQEGARSDGDIEQGTPANPCRDAWRPKRNESLATVYLATVSLLGCRNLRSWIGAGGAMCLLRTVWFVSVR